MVFSQLLVSAMLRKHILFFMHVFTLCFLFQNHLYITELDKRLDQATLVLGRTLMPTWSFSFKKHSHETTPAVHQLRWFSANSLFQPCLENTYFSLCMYSHYVFSRILYTSQNLINALTKLPWSWEGHCCHGGQVVPA